MRTLRLSAATLDAVVECAEQLDQVVRAELDARFANVEVSRLFDARRPMYKEPAREYRDAVNEFRHMLRLKDRHLPHYAEKSTLGAEKRRRQCTQQVGKRVGAQGPMPQRIKCWLRSHQGRWQRGRPRRLDQSNSARSSRERKTGTGRGMHPPRPISISHPHLLWTLTRFNRFNKSVVIAKISQDSSSPVSTCMALAHEVR